MRQVTSSFEELDLILERFSGSIRGAILKFGLDRRGIDPEDVVQEVKIKIWKQYANEKKMLDPSSYIKRVVDSTLIDQLRKFRIQEKIIQQEKANRLYEGNCFYQEPSRNSLLWEKIGEAIDSLIDSRRKVVKLFLLNLGVDEISVSLNLSKRKTQNLLYRGLSDIRKKLEAKGVNNENR